MSYVIPTVFFDSPRVINCSVTPIPALSSPPLEVIADSGIKIAIGIAFIDTTGHLIGVYVGPVGEEELVTVIGNGISGQAWGRFPVHSRVSIRSEENSAITAGLLQGGLATL